jgi:hypothetical protein
MKIMGSIVGDRSIPADQGGGDGHRGHLEFANCKLPARVERALQEVVAATELLALEEGLWNS